LFGTIRQELTPTEDRSLAIVRISAPEGVSLDFTSTRIRQIERLVQPMIRSGEVVNTFSLAGSRGTFNQGFMVLTLAPWEERRRSQQQIVAQLRELVKQVPGVQAYPVQPNSLGIRGAGNGLQFAVLGSDYAQLNDTAAKIVQAMEKDPRFEQSRLTNEATQPQLAVQIDRRRASDLGIDITGLAEAMQSMLDGNLVGSVFIEDRSYDVKLVSTTNPVNDPTDLENIFLKTADGRYVPMSTIATLKEIAVPPALEREQQMRSVGITSGLRANFALGDSWRVA